MRNKKLITAVLASGLMTAFSFTSLAAWQSDANGWWWQNDDGTRPANTWEWLDGNNDGVAECYYFGSDGYMAANTTTPDGYTVDANGAWYLGFVRRKYVLNDQQTEVFKEASRGLLSVYEEELYGPGGIDIQTRLKMDAERQLALLENLLMQSVRNYQSGEANPIFIPLRVEGNTGFFNREEVLSTFENLFGNLKDRTVFDRLGIEDLSVTASATEYSYRITSCSTDSDGTFIYMKMGYEKRNQNGEQLRNGTIYVELLREEWTENLYTIDCIGNQLRLG